VSDRYARAVADFLGAEPTEEQWRAISYPLEPFVLVAGAGSGKTSVMAARVIYLALAARGLVEADGVMPGNVLCLTFTNKATENLALRIRRALETIPGLEEGEEPEVLNYHGFAAQVIERHGMRIGIEPGQRVVTPAQRTEIAARVLDTMTFDRSSTRWQPAIVSRILALDEQLQNHLRTPEELEEHVRAKLPMLDTAKSDEPRRAAFEREELARAVAEFRRIKRSLGVIDFGDQIAFAVRIATERPEVGVEYRERFGAVLLDEYQDTNHAQATLMAELFGGGHPVTAVGDPDQNIYAWRGASLHNLLTFPEQFRRRNGSPAEKLPLYTNFRSGAFIMEAADQIIGKVPAKQRPDPDKRLVPFAPNGTGSVEVAQLDHELAEAEFVADRIVELHDGGHAWRSNAVLCRTHRLFEPLQVAFAARDIPAEFIGLAGLINMPEVVEVLAYARVAASAEDGVSLARILTGPRYRVSPGDLARVAAWTRESGSAFAQRLREDRADEDGSLLEDRPFLIAEALEHLDEVRDLSDEARTRLQECRRELAELREAARRPVASFLAEIVRRTGLLAELDAEVDRATASAKRRNLAAFLEQVDAFQPVEGELSLASFLSYLDSIEDDREWNPVQPSDDDSVKVMTIHAAKGLEFDTVFVPGLAKGLFPDVRVQENPARKAQSLDVELRRDRHLLPAFDGVMSHFARDLREQEEFEERRTAYVALTRARRRLFVSAGWWYGESLRADKGPGALHNELVHWANKTGHAVARFEAEEHEGNPLAGYRQASIRGWPGPALRVDEADDLFPEGWRAAAVESARAGAVLQTTLDRLGPEELRAFGELEGDRRTLARHLREREDAEGDHPWIPGGASVGGVIEYARCPRRFYWTAVRPLPRFSGPAARIGTEVHRWIERQSRGQATLLEIDDVPDLTAEELAGEPGKMQDLRASFLASRFADKVPLFAERPFLLSVDGFTIRGRIDAIYGEPDGPWEVVDYKTGRRPDPEDEISRLQLDVYALACIDVWHKRAEELSLTYLYLASGTETTHTVDDEPAVRAGLRDWLRGIGDARFEATPGPQCRWCDFLPFCAEGKAHVGEDDAHGAPAGGAVGR
jgi:DNA helicase-2/ATP-dependent DNA helicase PcrA